MVMRADGLLLSLSFFITAKEKSFLIDLYLWLETTRSEKEADLTEKTESDVKEEPSKVFEGCFSRDQGNFISRLMFTFIEPLLEAA